MRKRSVSSCLAAADIYEAAAAAAGPATATMQLKAADAINCAMRIETNGNIMVLEGTVDTPAAKKFWAAHGPRSLSLIRAAKKDAALAADAWFAATEMDSFMYSSSSKGIVSQALTGAGTEFKRLSEVLVNRHGALDSGVGRCYLAGLYNIAPWPIGDKKRALQEVLLSLGRHPGSRRNNYYACMMSLQAGEAAKAVSHCEAAMRARCIGPTEPDYCTFMTSEVQRLLTVAKARLA